MMIPMYPAVLYAITRITEKMIPCRLMDKINEPATFPVDWKIIVISRTIPTNTKVMTCKRSMSMPSFIMLSLFLKHFIKNGADIKITAVKTAAVILIN